MGKNREKLGRVTCRSCGRRRAREKKGLDLGSRKHSETALDRGVASYSGADRGNKVIEINHSRVIGCDIGQIFIEFLIYRRKLFYVLRVTHRILIYYCDLYSFERKK